MKEMIKELFLQQGADICGIAHIERFKNAPDGFHPSDIYPECRSVIVFGKPVPKGTMLVNPRIVYQHNKDIMLSELDHIAFMASVKIEQTFADSVAVPVPSDDPYDSWDADTMTGRGILSMRHAAVLAGLGALGKSTLVLNKRYGTLLNFCAVLTNLELESDDLAENICLEGCHKCIDNCPSGALGENGITQKPCRNYAYGNNERGFDITNCNNCRKVCPMAFGK